MTTFIKPAAASFGKVLSAVALMLALYVLTAPPLMILMTRQNPREWPRIYRPLAAGFWCDWSRPVFSWYFDTLWKANTESRGE